MQTLTLAGQAVTRTPSGVAVTSGAFTTEVQLWADNTVRVQHRPLHLDHPPLKSLTVIASPKATDIAPQHIPATPCTFT